MNEKFRRDQKPKKFFRGTKIKCWYIQENIYLFNPFIFNMRYKYDKENKKMSVYM